MACLKCPLVTLAEMRPDLADFAGSGAELLCPKHFREFSILKLARVRREVRECARVFCPAFCGTEMYLIRPGVCERCRLGLGPPVKSGASSEHPRPAWLPS